MPGSYSIKAHQVYNIVQRWLLVTGVFGKSYLVIVIGVLGTRAAHCYQGLDWTAMALQKGLAGPSAKANMLWVMERRSKREKLLFMECTVLFEQKAAIEDGLGDLYNFEIVVLGPDDFGVPAMRPRKFIVGVLRDWGAMLNPVCHPVFGVRRFFREPALSGDDLFLAPQETKQKYFQEMAKRKQLNPAAVALLSPRDLLPVGCDVRLDAYIAKCVNADPVPSSNSTASKNFIIMLGQTEAFGPLSKLMPTLTRTALVWSMSRQEPMVPCDHFTVMGLPIHSQGDYHCPFQKLLAGAQLDDASGSGSSASGSLSSAQMKQLAGNSISLQVCGAVILYALMNLQRRDSSAMSRLHSDSILEDTQDEDVWQD